MVDRYIWDVEVASSSLVTPIQPYLAEINKRCPSFVILDGHLLSPILVYLQRSLQCVRCRFCSYSFSQRGQRCCTGRQDQYASLFAFVGIVM